MSLLEDYLKELNSLETAKRDSKFTRILSIDFVKGFAMCLIMLAHLAESWINDEWYWAYALIYAWLDVFGPSLFIFLSALSVVFSMKKKEGIISNKAIKKGIYIRAVVVASIGLVFNVALNRKAPFPLNIWGWNILMFIGFAQIICFYAVKLKKWTRVIIGLLVAFSSYFIRDFLAIYKNENPVVWVLHYIVVSPEPSLTIIPYVAFCFISTIFGEMFFESMLLETKSSYMHTFYNFLAFGLSFTITGIILGWEFQTLDTIDSEEYPFINLLPLMQNQSFFQVEGMPLFLIQGTAANQFYSLGCALLILGITFYAIDIRHLNKMSLHLGGFNLPFSPGANMFIFIGRVSLSLFFIHFIWTAVYFRQLTAFTFFPIVIAFIGFLAILLYLWNKYFDGKYSFEWLLSSMGKKKKKRR